MNPYPPEGMGEDTTLDIKTLEWAMKSGKILQAPATMCNTDHDLIVDLGKLSGRIPRAEAVIGIDTGDAKEIAIISRVGRSVCFKVLELTPEIILSRKAAQQEALDYMMENLQPGDIIPAVVTHLASFGAFVDIGCGVISLLGVENISISRISHTSDRLEVDQRIYAAVLSVDSGQKRITLTHKELLGTWEQNASRFGPGETVAGIVRGKKDYGLFVELTPNLSGLAEYRDDIEVGDRVSVFIKAIIPEKMKIKLVAIERLDKARDKSEFNYYMTGGKLDKWSYPPEECQRDEPETVFN